MIGENGAYQASFNGAGGAGTDIASPGFAAIPEPGSALMLVGMAFFVCLGRRRVV